MKILVPCGGTRGDTQPCVALACALRQRGHEVVFFSPTTHVALSRDQGFRTVEFELDVEALLEKLLSSKSVRNYGSGLSFMREAMKVMNQPEVVEKLKTILPKLWELAQEVKPDLMMSARPLPALGICEKLRIPYVQIAFQAYYPTSESPPFFVNDGLPLAWFPCLHKCLHERLLPKLLSNTYSSMELRKFNREALRLEDPKAMEALCARIYETMPTIVAAPESVLPRPRDYPKHVPPFVGWYFLESSTDAFEPSAELEAFLASEESPVVYVGFGSMKGSEEMSSELTRLVLRALRLAGLRGFLLGGWSGLTRERLRPEDSELKAWAAEHVMELKAVPHSWLFPRVAAVCHHGGSGTTAAGLRAGRPTVICPFIADQPYWAAMVEKQGLGLRCRHISKVTAEMLAPKLKAAATDPEMRRRAAEAGEAIRGTDSCGRSVALIEEFAATFPYPWRVESQEQGKEAEEKRRRAWPPTPTTTCCSPLAR